MDSFSPSLTTWQFASESERDTDRLGSALASVVKPGMVIALVGELGTGKTRLVQGLAEALGANRKSVTSPTFVLIQEYEARLPIYHFDTYRLRDFSEFVDLGALELLESDGVCVIEWADRVKQFLPDDHLQVKISMTSEFGRAFELTSTGPTSSQLLVRLRQEIESS